MRTRDVLLVTAAVAVVPHDPAVAEALPPRHDQLSHDD
jgi:hypothetical protein